MTEENTVLPMTKSLGKYYIQSAVQAFKQLNGAESALYLHMTMGTYKPHSNLNPMNKFLTLLSGETSVNFVYFS